MSDHGHHDPGGHELEAINTKLLFRLLFSLSLVTLLAAMAVVQWFNSQRRELDNRYAAEGSFMLQEHDAEMAKRLEGIDLVAADMATSADKLKAPAAPPGWIHPDDLVGGGAAAAAPAEPKPEPKPEPTEDEAIPVPAPEGDAPAEGDDAVPADGAEGDDAKPEEPKDDAPKGNQGKDEEAKADKPKSNQGKDEEAKADKADKKADDGE